MMRSLYSGVSGLKTHQTKMDVIGNNIANVNTVAYKSTSVTFQELMYQNTSSASSPNADTGRGGVNAKQIGLGVSMGATNVSITTTGATQTTGNPFDLKITGDSFFIVNDGQSNYFTRAGAFYVDAVGNLAMSSTGYNVMGWQVGADGEIIQNTVSPIKILSADHMFSQPEATELGTCSGVLDKSDPNLTSDSGKILSLSLYDDLGYEYTAKFSIKPFKTAKASTKPVTNTSTTYGSIPEIKKVDTDYYSFKIKQGPDDESGDPITETTAPIGKDASGKAMTLMQALEQFAKNHGLGNKDSSGNIPYSQISLDYNETTVPTGAKYQVSGKNTIEELINILHLTDSTTPSAAQFRIDPSIVGDGKILFVNKDTVSSFNIMKDGKAIEMEGISEKSLDTLCGFDDASGTHHNGILEKTGDTYKARAGVDFVRYESRYYDGEAPAISFYAIGNDPSDTTTYGIKDDLTEGFKSIPSDEMGIFLGACESKDITIVDTEQAVNNIQYIEGQYTVELSELVDIANGKSVVDTSILGDTSQTLMYDTNNGTFRYIGAEGQKTFNLNLSALGGKFHNIAIDFSTTQNVSNEGTSTIGMKAGDEDGKGAGKLLGALKGVAVDSNGKIYGSYDNGNTELLGQIAVTEFANASGLEKVGDNLYQTTLNSGEFDGIGRDISSLSGSMSTGVLEMSNVDLSAEFTDMITTQRGFQANSRIITTSDTLLEELINLKR